MSNVWGPPYIVDGPRPVAPKYRLVDVATIVPDPDGHWQNGAQVHSYPPDCPVSWNPCDTGTERVKANGGTIPIPEFGAFTVVLAETCTPRSFGDAWEAYRDRVVAAFEATESHAVEIEFATGAELPLNPYLGDSNLQVVTSSASAPRIALGLLEDAIAATCRAGIIHVSPAALDALAADHQVVERNGRLETNWGTPIAVGTGYVGVIPLGQGSLLAANTAWIFATGPVQIRRSEVFVNPGSISEALDRTNNVVTFYAERNYLVDWDTVLQAGALLDLSGCCGADGGGGGGGGGDASAANQVIQITAEQAIQAAVEGTLDVAVVAALPAGTNNIGDVDIASLPNEGQQTMANSISVAVASDQSTLPVKELRAATSAVTTVADTAASTTLLASNANRLGATIENDSSATLYVKFGTTATTTDYTVQIPFLGYFEVPFNYTGRIDGIWATDPGNGAARITELTA